MGKEKKIKSQRKILRLKFIALLGNENIDNGQSRKRKHWQRTQAIESANRKKIKTLPEAQQTLRMVSESELLKNCYNLKALYGLRKGINWPEINNKIQAFTHKNINKRDLVSFFFPSEFEYRWDGSMNHTFSFNLLSIPGISFGIV